MNDRFHHRSLDGNEFIATTMHLKVGYMRRNGAARSDRATITTHFRRHGNMLIGEMTRRYGIRVDALMGGAETMYPEYREVIKPKFVMPAKCAINCGGG